ncbi:hypothetical protein PR048_032655 [Dryococelus australis]|uniref:Uncharacterized protein n=1 Tax=Dryococelus australis TaxID=614101 RepID=A0ABQ9G2T9_9NEOP|nr:hypothetical protein PR048_032655 [Dryococelus australis]
MLCAVFRQRLALNLNLKLLRYGKRRTSTHPSSCVLPSSEAAVTTAPGAARHRRLFSKRTSLICILTRATSCVIFGLVTPGSELDALLRCLHEPTSESATSWERGLRCAVVRLLASLLAELDSIPGGVSPGFSDIGFVPDDATCRRTRNEVAQCSLPANFPNIDGRVANRAFQSYKFNSDEHVCLPSLFQRTVTSRYFASLPLVRASERSYVRSTDLCNGLPSREFMTVGSLGDFEALSGRRRARRSTSGDGGWSKICDCERRCNEECDWQVGLLNWMLVYRPEVAAWWSPEVHLVIRSQHIAASFRYTESCRRVSHSHATSAEMHGWKKRDIPEKTLQPAASSGTIPTCLNPGVDPPWWEAGSLTTEPLVDSQREKPEIFFSCENAADVTFGQRDFSGHSGLSLSLHYASVSSITIAQDLAVKLRNILEVDLSAGIQKIRVNSPWATSCLAAFELVEHPGQQARLVSLRENHEGRIFQLLPEADSRRRLTTVGHTHLHVFLVRCPDDLRYRSQCYVCLYRARCLVFSASFTSRWREFLRLSFARCYRNHARALVQRLKTAVEVRGLTLVGSRKRSLVGGRGWRCRAIDAGCGTPVSCLATRLDAAGREWARSLDEERRAWSRWKLDSRFLQARTTGKNVLIGPQWGSGQIITSHIGKPGSIPGLVAARFPLAEIVPDDVAGLGVFSGISRFPLPCIPALLHTHLTSPSFAFKISMLTAAQISALSTSHNDVLTIESSDEQVKSDQSKPGSSLHVGIVPGISRFPPPFHPGAAPFLTLASPSSALKTSMLRAAQILSTHPPGSASDRIMSSVAPARRGRGGFADLISRS